MKTKYPNMASYRSRINWMATEVGRMLLEDYTMKYTGQQQESKFYFNQYLEKYQNKLKRLSIEDIKPIYERVKAQYDFDKGNCVETYIGGIVTNLENNLNDYYKHARKVLGKHLEPITVNFIMKEIEGE